MLFIDKIVVWMSKVLCLFIGIFHKILSISVISIICASNVCAQGRSLAFSSDIGAAYVELGVMRNVEL